MPGGISLRGDYTKLRGLIATLKDFAGFGPLSKLSDALGETALAEVRRGFRGQVDPYDDPWAPLKRRKGRVLRDTGRLANSFSRVRSNARGFLIGSNVGYGAVHQYGASFTSRNRTEHRYKGRFVSAARVYTRGRKKSGGLRKGYSTGWSGSHAIGIPARPMLPYESRGLGPRWTSALERTSKRVMGRLLRRRG